ncbi:MAG: UDP-N-acetylmuramoyl-L-alanine--D-glutamate ligase [Ruminococcaceae bacterium]|nr:UDP-N-acetylmuramoyl-L-alanine--D-glutamate ligase [Oscillospiraceae bacterium]
MLLQEINRGTSVALLGFGRANRAVADVLLKRGARLSVYDEHAVDEAAAAPYREKGVSFAPVGFPPSFSEEVLVRSPGLRPDLAAIRASRGILTSETELLLDAIPAHTVGVTGSDGKTTTANLIAVLLRAAGYRVWLGGNNGTPLLPFLGEMEREDIAVVELSSFQLMTLQRHPDRAVITNIVPNHLNWHTDMAEYEGAKRRIAGKDTHLALNADDPRTRAIGRGRENTCFFGMFPEAEEREHFAYREGDDALVFGRRFHGVFEAFRLAGKHNEQNLLAALAAVGDLLDVQGARAALTDFCGVPHRLQYVATVNGTDYYNSSIDTSPTRTAAALSAMPRKPLVIAGGRGKGISLLPLADALAKGARTVLLYGETAREIEAALGGRVPSVCCRYFKDAFDAAVRVAGVGDIVLLSPGCTAFGEFRDFEERGNVFCALVAALQGKE